MPLRHVMHNLHINELYHGPGQWILKQDAGYMAAASSYDVSIMSGAGHLFCQVSTSCTSQLCFAGEIKPAVLATAASKAGPASFSLPNSQTSFSLPLQAGWWLAYKAWSVNLINKWFGLTLEVMTYFYCIPSNFHLDQYSRQVCGNIDISCDGGNTFKIEQ